jgi:D-glycero-alpha-D-manno-heptose-7-phosphate kinase
MLITRTPLRITLGGGGTDLPEYYQKNGGFWISATIDKYIYVAINTRFEKELRIVYSKLENVFGNNDIQHPIIKEIFKRYNIWKNQEFITYADLPGSSGLGSSGAFTVGAIKAFNSTIDRTELAEQAFGIERYKLNRSIGKQDQYSASFGGMRIYTVDKNGNVTNTPIINPELAQKLMLIYTGNIRDSEKMLSKVKESESQLKEIERIGRESVKSIMERDYQKLGSLMDEHWQIKKSITPEMTTPEIDKTYTTLLNMGAVGGKIVGAGSGGFIMVVIPDERTRMKILQSNILEQKLYVPFKITYVGSEVLVGDG